MMERMMNAHYTCPICGLTYNAEEDLSTPSMSSPEERIERLEYRARTFINAHERAHPQTTKHPPTRSIPDGNQEGTPEEGTRLITEEEEFLYDIVLYSKDGGLVGARWTANPGNAVINLAAIYGFNLVLDRSGRWDYDRSLNS